MPIRRPRCGRRRPCGRARPARARQRRPRTRGIPQGACASSPDNAEAYRRIGACYDLDGPLRPCRKPITKSRFRSQPRESRAAEGFRRALERQGPGPTGAEGPGGSRRTQRRGAAVAAISARPRTTTPRADRRVRQLTAGAVTKPAPPAGGQSDPPARRLRCRPVRVRRRPAAPVRCLSTVSRARLQSTRFRSMPAPARAGRERLPPGAAARRPRCSLRLSRRLPATPGPCERRRSVKVADRGSPAFARAKWPGDLAAARFGDRAVRPVRHQQMTVPLGPAAQSWLAPRPNIRLLNAARREGLAARTPRSSSGAAGGRSTSAMPRRSARKSVVLLPGGRARRWAEALPPSSASAPARSSKSDHVRCPARSRCRCRSAPTAGMIGSALIALRRRGAATLCTRPRRRSRKPNMRSRRPA